MSARSLSRCALVCFLSTVFLLGGCQALQTGSQNAGTTPSSEQQHTSVKKPEEKQDVSQCDPRVITRTEVVYKPVEIGNKLVIGAIEQATFENLGLTMEARIDTGATTSSLGATDIRLFERDGRQWVSFRLNGEQNDKDSLVVERQVARNVMIKRHGKESQQRPVIKLKVRIGKIEQMAEFTLTDRSQFEYPVLVGRNILTDMAIVDVSHEYLVSKKKIADGKQP
ncbi:ATP-dependent zinc protease family protein [Kistimonas asteriae]|uniref:ATP-dependent zinc protease family protein n=1 Tax=Kistimonas asteriae TaxID=517724 RepID=UPI001BABC41B|nr:RimK/LysX family protein [Kistimonas asteriae]